MALDTKALFTEHFEQAIEEQRRFTDKPPEEWTRTGRATKQYPDKEGPEFWLENGPHMIDAYVAWRREHGFPIWVTPEGVPGIELEIATKPLAPGLPGLKGVIDRIFVDTNSGTLVIVDLKGLALDTLIPTPDGFKAMRDVQLGDVVYGSDGKRCQVTAVSDVKMLDCYAVTFDTGERIVCDSEHLWWAIDHDERRSAKRAGRQPQPEVVDVDTMRERFYTSNGQRRWTVPVAGPLEGGERNLPVDPYLLGVWLGDGRATAGEVTKTEDFFSHLGEMYDLLPPRPDKHSKAVTRTVKGLRGALRRAGLLGYKHIPSGYLRASVDQRLALMRGLFDTDGSWNTARNRATWVSTDKALALQVHELACSLGFRATVQTWQANGFGVGTTAYGVEVSGHPHNPFLWPAKAERVVASEAQRVRSSRRVITSIERVPTVPTKCIAVNSPDNTYLAGESMIPTHNTGKMHPKRQLGFYKVMVQMQWPDIQIDLGAFWKARDGKMSELIDLSYYTQQTLADLVGAYHRGVTNRVIAPVPSSFCGTCSVREFCAEQGGERAGEIPPF